jgi:hypothetical protein
MFRPWTWEFRLYSVDGDSCTAEFPKTLPEAWSSTWEFVRRWITCRKLHSLCYLQWVLLFLLFLHKKSHIFTNLFPRFRLQREWMGRSQTLHCSIGRTSRSKIIVSDVRFLWSWSIPLCFGLLYGPGWVWSSVDGEFPQLVGTMSTPW